MKTNIETYLKSAINDFPDYTFNKKEKRQIKRSLDDFIINKVFSNKFRKFSPSKETKNDIVKRISKSILSKKPLHFTIPTGGYKKWQLDSAPKCNWSEVFHLRYMLEYFSPILKTYKPGVILDYFSNAWLIKFISYYPQEDLDVYTKSFRELIKLFEKSFPSNLKINYRVVAEQKDEKTLLKRILKNRSEVEKEWKDLSKQEKELGKKASERNIRWDILEKERKLTKEERDKYIYEGKIIHDSLLRGGWNTDLDYLFNGNRIAIIHRKTKDKFLHIATSPGAFVQFWVGTGIVERRKDDILPRVLSFQQYNNIKNKLTKIKTSFTGLSNLANIELLNN